MSRAKRGKPAERTVPAGKFKAGCLELLDEVRDRHLEIVVTKRGKPVAKVVPIDDERVSSPIGFMRGTVIDGTDLVTPEHEWWRESASDPLATRAGR